MKRRHFLASAALLPLAPALAGGASVSAVIYDPRHAASRRFAESLGVRAFAVTPDAAALWHGDLARHLAAHPGRVAGLTRFADAQLALGLGQEAGLAPLFHGRHDARSGTTTRHALRLFALTSAWPDPATPQSLARGLGALGARGAMQEREGATVGVVEKVYLESWVLG